MTALKERQCDPTRYTMVQYEDGTCDLLTPEEVEFMYAYREAGAEDRQRYDRVLRHMHAGGVHPSAAEFAAMTPDAIREWMDSLPEPQA